MSKAPGINDRRNGYLVSKALRTFMWASILAALAGQIATTTDAIVVSHLIGPDAISAVNVTEVPDPFVSWDIKEDDSLCGDIVRHPMPKSTQHMK